MHATLPFFIRLLTGCLLALFAVAQAHADASTSPGKNAVYVSATLVSSPGGGEFIIGASGTIAKGKKGRVLEISIVMVEPLTNSANCMAARPIVNGTNDLAEPVGLGGTESLVFAGGGVGNDSFMGRWWLDLDVAESARPGTFQNQPLVIDAQVATCGSTQALTVSLAAHMQKK